MAKRCRVYKPMAQDGYNFTGVTDPTQYMGDLIESGQNIDKEAYFNAWNASPQGKNLPYSTNIAPSPDSVLYSPIRRMAPPTPPVDAVQNIKGSYNPQYGSGPQFKKRMVLQDGGKPETGYTVTQDSNPDPIPEEKSNNFLTWLHKTNQEKRLDDEIEASMQQPPVGYMQQGGMVSMDQLRSLFQPQQQDPSKSGYETGDYLEKKDTNFAMHATALQNRPGMMENITNLSAAAGMFNPQSKTQQPMDGDVYTEQSSIAPPPEKEPFSFGAKPGGFGEMGQGFQLRDGGMIYAQDGVSYPGQMPLMEEIDTETLEAIQGRLAEQQYAQQQNPENMYQTEKDFNYNQMQEFEPGGDDDPFKKDKKGLFSADPNKSNAQHTNEAQAIIAGTQAVTGIFDYRNRRQQEEKLKRRFSNVFETHGTAGSDRGDYLSNVPGVGDSLKPDQHTRMGYNTKIAQDGYQIDDEVELTETEINNLIAQGYNLEYLD